MRSTLFVIFAVLPLAAQDGHGVTPADIQRGGEIFLSNCASCHGPDGDALAGVNLGVNRFRRAQTDHDLIELLKKGIPGTAMPPGNYTDAQGGMIVAYLRSMATAPKAKMRADLLADPTRGKAIVETKGQCLSCHRIGPAGSVAGPDLTAIGALRRAADLETSLLDPDAEIRQNNRTVRAIRADGSVVTGTLLNQDTYSLQILDSSAKLVSLNKEKLRSFEFLKTSPMPSYKDKLSPQELADTLSYLITLRGPV